MDKHHAHVIAAAETLRTWVLAQRASWSSPDRFEVVHPSMHAVALPRSIDPPWPPVAVPDFISAFPTPWVTDAVAEVVDAPAVAASVPVDLAALPVPRVNILERAGDLIDAVRPLASLAGPALRWGGRMALVTGVAAGLVWAAREYQARRIAAPARVVAVAAPATSAEKKPAAPPAEAPVKRTGRLQIDSDPSGALVLVDGKERGTAPLAIDNVAAGSHAVVFQSPKGTVQRTVTVTANRTTQVNEGIYSGWLHVSSPIALQVAAGDRSVRLDDSNQVLLPPGSHVLTLTNRALEFHDTRDVEITPGGTVSVTIEPPQAMLTVTTSEPAQVLLDGDVIGDAPLSDHPANIGTHDISVRTPSGQIRHATITLPTTGARVDIDFSKP